MEGLSKNRNFRLDSTLSNHQLKINCYKPRLIYMKHMITTNQKSMRDVQKNKEKGIQTEHYRKSSTYKRKEEVKKEQRRTTIRKS